MRCCVVLAVLLSLVLFSKGNSDTTPDTTPSASTASEGNSDTTPDTTPSASTASEGNSDATPETTPSARAGSEGNNNTITETTASTTSGSEGNNNTITETTASTTSGSEGNNTITETTASTTASTTSGSEGNNNTITETTASTTSGSEGNNNTITETTASTTSGSEGNNTITETTASTTASTTSGSEGNNNTITETTASTTSGSEGNNNTITETTASTTSGSEGNNNTITETTASTTSGSEGNNNTITETTASTTSGSEGNNNTITETTASTTSGSEGINTIAETTAWTTTESEGTNLASSSATKPATRDFCNPDPCGKKLARCVALNSTFTCRCQYGFYFLSGNCHAGKIFPGVITLNVPYSSSVQTVNSLEYEEMFNNITVLFEDAFKGLGGFAETVIVEIQQIQSESRASSPVSVTVTNLFMDNSNVTNQTVTEAIDAEIKDSKYVSKYTATTYCAAFKCDTRTTRCEEAMHPVCLCQDDYAKTEWDERSCSDCSESCSSEQNKYCERAGGVPTCKCMANFKKKNGSCVPCPVGYAGEDCKDNTELILIILGTVLGAIILSLLIAVSIVSVRSKHRQDPEQKRLIKSEYSNSNSYADDRQTTMFPRVQTTSGHANPGYQPNNPYETCSTNRGQYDDLYEISRGHEGFRMQSRY